MHWFKKNMNAEQIDLLHYLNRTDLEKLWITKLSSIILTVMIFVRTLKQKYIRRSKGKEIKARPVTKRKRTKTKVVESRERKVLVSRIFRRKAEIHSRNKTNLQIRTNANPTRLNRKRKLERESLFKLKVWVLTQDNTNSRSKICGLSHKNKPKRINLKWRTTYQKFKFQQRTWEER